MKKLTILVRVGSPVPLITSDEKESDNGQQSPSGSENEQRQAGTPIQKNDRWNFNLWKASIMSGSKPKDYFVEPFRNEEKNDEKK